jgi:hypothetical protein
MLYEMCLIAAGIFLGQEYHGMPNIKVLTIKTIELFSSELEKFNIHKP